MNRGLKVGSVYVCVCFTAGACVCARSQRCIWPLIPGQRSSTLPHLPFFSMAGVHSSVWKPKTQDRTKDSSLPPSNTSDGESQSCSKNSADRLFREYSRLFPYEQRPIMSIRVWYCEPVIMAMFRLQANLFFFLKSDLFRQTVRTINCKWSNQVCVTRHNQLICMGCFG